MLFTTGDLITLSGRGYRDLCTPLMHKDLKCKHCQRSFQQYGEKPVDGKIIDLLYRATNLANDGDVIALASGDGDFFEPVLFIAQTFKVSVEVWSYSSSVSHLYRGRKEFSFHPLDALRMVG